MSGISGLLCFNLEYIGLFFFCPPERKAPAQGSAGLCACVASLHRVSGSLTVDGGS